MGVHTVKTLLLVVTSWAGSLHGMLCYRRSRSCDGGLRILNKRREVRSFALFRTRVEDISVSSTELDHSWTMNGVYMTGNVYCNFVKSLLV